MPGRRRQFWTSPAFLLMALLALAIGWLPGAGVTAAPCSASGVISTDTVWSPSTCDPYIVTGSVVVERGATLTIQPGTTVKFDGLKALLVQGTLVARGTEAGPITFTSNQATPAPGDWASIYFAESSTDATFDGGGSYLGGSIIQYALIEYAGGGSATENGALRIEASSPYIDHNTIGNNGAAGIYAWNQAEPRIANNTITGNTASGSRVGGIWASGTATISNNTVSNNSGGYAGGIYAVGTATISNNRVSNNSGGYAGGVRAEGTATISNNTITGNTAYGSPGAGGIWASGAVTISNNTITANTASGSFGGVVGGLWFQSCGGTSTIAGNTVVSNTATQAYNKGGGIYLASCRPVISNNDLYGNTSGSPPTPNDLYNDNPAGGAELKAEDNYWGTTDFSAIAAHIWDFFDDASLGLVDYIPYRSTPVGPAPIPTPTPTLTPTPTPTPSIPNLSVTKLAGREMNRAKSCRNESGTGSSPRGEACLAPTRGSLPARDRGTNLAPLSILQ